MPGMAQKRLNYRVRRWQALVVSDPEQFLLEFSTYLRRLAAEANRRVGTLESHNGRYLLAFDLVDRVRNIVERIWPWEVDAEMASAGETPAAGKEKNEDELLRNLNTGIEDLRHVITQLVAHRIGDPRQYRLTLGRLDRLPIALRRRRPHPPKGSKNPGSGSAHAVQNRH